MERRQPTIVEFVMIALVAGAIGIAAGYWTRKNLAEAKIASAEEAARKILDDAQHQADATGGSAGGLHGGQQGRLVVAVGVPQGVNFGHGQGR